MSQVDTQSNSFLESIKALLVVFRIFGIDPASGHFYGALCLALNVVLCLTSLVTLTIEIDSFFLSTKVLITVDLLAVAVSNTTAHFTLYHLRNDWYKLARSIDIVPSNSNYRVRLWANHGLVLIILKQICTMVFIVLYYGEKNLSTLSLYCDMSLFFLQIYSNWALLLWLSMIKSIGYQLESFRHEVDQTSTNYRPFQWLKTHASIVQNVGHLNSVFQMTICIEICCIVVASIANIFYILLGILDGAAIMTVFGFGLIVGLERIIQLVLISGLADGLTNEASLLLDCLRTLQANHQDDQQVLDIQSRVNLSKDIHLKLKGLVDQVYYAVPKIQAGGFFNVDGKLIPTVFGATLTYLLILYQMKSSKF